MSLEEEKKYASLLQVGISFVSGRKIQVLMFLGVVLASDRI